MSDWQYTLELGDFYHDFDLDSDDSISLPQLAEKVTDRIKKLIPEISKGKWSDYGEELENDILPLFEEIAENKVDDVEQFHYAMEALYDWADTPLDEKFGGKKMCWVNTFRPATPVKWKE